MAQYLTRPRQQRRSPRNTSADEQNQCQLSLSSQQSDWIFPHPSSAPSSPSLASELSESVALSLRSESLSRSVVDGVNHSPPLTLGTDHTPESRTPVENFQGLGSEPDNDSEELEWELDWSTDLDNESDFLMSPLEGPDRFDHKIPPILNDHHSPRSSHRRPTGESSAPYIYTTSLEKAYRLLGTHTSQPEHSVETLVLHPRTSGHDEHLPLLSLIASILFIDKSTLHLITVPDARPIIFPGVCLDPDVPPPDVSEALGTHGTSKLLMGHSDTPLLKEEFTMLYQGEDVVQDSDFSIGNVLPSLWDFVNEVFTSRGKTWHRLWRTYTA